MTIEPNGDAGSRTLVADVAAALPRNVRRMRITCGWTQEQLAEGMQKIGFKWSRVTVTEIEPGGHRRRRISAEEWIGLGTVFGVPILAFLDDFYEGGEQPQIRVTVGPVTVFESDAGPLIPTRGIIHSP